MPSPDLAETSGSTAVTVPGRGYLVTLATSTVITLFAHHVWPDEPTVRGQPVSVMVGFGLLLVAGILWWRYRPIDQPPWTGLMRATLITLAALWAVTVVLSLVHGDLFNPTTLILPIALAMIWFKRPSSAAATTALDVWAIVIVAIAIAAVVLDFSGLVPIHPEGTLRWPLQVLKVFGVDARATVPIMDINACPICYGYISRWAGPFGNVNYAGPIGASLVMIGLFRARWWRWGLLAAGAVILVVSDSRTGIIAIAAGLAAIALTAPRIAGRPVRPWFRWAVLAAAIAVLVGYVAFVDRTLNLRTEVWREFLLAWPTSPIIGVGGEGITALITAGDLPGWASHGHSLLIDPLLRFGLVGALLVGATIALLITVTVRAARTGAVLPLALVASAIGAGFTEDLLDWRYLSVDLTPLLLAAIIAATALDGARTGEARLAGGESRPVGVG